MKPIALALSAFALLAPVAHALAAPRWTTARASATIKANYSTIDQKAYDYAQQRGLTDAMATAKHAAKPTTVSCAKAHSGFHCSATVQGSARIPPDYKLYTATKRLTLRVTGSHWRILNGWR